MIRHTKHGLKAWLLMAVVAMGIGVPTQAVTIGSFSFSCSVTVSGPGGSITITVDPWSVESFQLDVEFDPSLVAFDEILYESPYLQTTSPDLSSLGSGLVQDIAGASSVNPPPPGDVDIFSITFLDLDPNADKAFRIFASANDFVILLDPDTGQQMTLGEGDIQECRALVHTPDAGSTFTLLGASALGLIVSTVRGRGRA